jgi:hypothetical protein
MLIAFTILAEIKDFLYFVQKASFSRYFMIRSSSIDGPLAKE